jgi:hypothetical protein
MKDTGFSPYINGKKRKGALAPERMPSQRPLNRKPPHPRYVQGKKS